MEFELNVTGTFDMISQTLTLTLTDVNDMLAINLVAAPPGFDPSDYGARVEGQYLGSGNVTGALEADLSDVQIALERVDKELVKIKMTANVPGLNEVTLAGDAIEVSEGTGANTYALNGTATASIGEFSVTGTYNATEKTLAIKLAAAIAVIEVTAVKQE
jgi:methylmalonyl-CoA mutase N-terminal domain/subunit